MPLRGVVPLRGVIAPWTQTVSPFGNVWEWTNDWYAEDYYSISPQTDPQGPVSGITRVRRGGSFADDGYVWLLRSSLRTASHPGSPNYTFGFRCARSQQLDMLRITR